MIRECSIYEKFPHLLYAYLSEKAEMINRNLTISLRSLSKEMEYFEHEMA